MFELDLEGIKSSYIEHNYGYLFYTVTMIEDPDVVVELGTYQGYSGLHLAAGLRDRGRAASQLSLIDLWDMYAFRHCSLDTTVENFRRNGALDLDQTKASFVNESAL